MLERALKRFVSDEAGATAIEYSLLAGLIAVVAIAGVFATGGGVSSLFDYIKDNAIPALTPKG
ncbi:Flp family type IVb pilin [Devosia sp. D6-9]|nr:Flp family type IVb pilin [Devosia sp. D6-9]